MAPVDQDRELDRARPAEVHERVHRRADRPAGEEDVVDEEDAPSLDRERDVGPLHDGVLDAAVEVVAVERDVDDAEGRQRAALDLLHLPAEALGEVDAARADADQREVLASLVALEDLVRDADERALDRERVHHLTGAVPAHPPPVRDAKTPPRPCREALLAPLAMLDVVTTFPDLAGSS